MKKLSKPLSLFAAILLSSCATIFTGTHDTLVFESKPSGAKVLFDGYEICKTPCTTSLKRSLNEKSVEFKLEGYQTRRILLDREFNAVSIINLGSILGWAIDAATGSMMKYGNKVYEIELEPQNPNALLLQNPYKIEIDTKNKLVDVYVLK